MEKKKKELLKPRYDVVFQALFGSNQDNITQSLLSDILGEQVEIIDIKVDATIARQYPHEKRGKTRFKNQIKRWKNMSNRNADGR